MTTHRQKQQLVKASLLKRAQRMNKNKGIITQSMIDEAKREAQIKIEARKARQNR
jgi:hypothetical protein